MNYSVLREVINGSIVYMEYDLDGYTFHPKTKNANFIQVSTVTVYNKSMIDFLLTKKFRKKFDKLSDIIVRFLYQDEDEGSDESDFIILLDEVARLKSVVELKYQRFLEVSEYQDYIHKLTFLDNQLRQKIALINYKNNLYYEANMGGRSM